MEMCLHTQACRKAANFGVSQSSGGRKIKREAVHDLNVQEKWARRPRLASTSSHRGHYF